MGPRLWGSAGAGSRTTSLECVQEHLVGTTSRWVIPNALSVVAVMVSAKYSLRAYLFKAGELDSASQSTSRFRHEV